MASQILIVHERIGVWARQLRPRVNDWPLRLVETRSIADLDAALDGAKGPLVLIDLSRRPIPALHDLRHVLDIAPEALTLVLDPEAQPGVSAVAKEIGATLVLSGPLAPPDVARILARWLPLAARRAEGSGWFASAPRPQQVEPWSWLAPMLESWPYPVSQPNN